jgi:hypothetical protein
MNRTRVGSLILIALALSAAGAIGYGKFRWRFSGRTGGPAWRGFLLGAWRPGSLPSRRVRC